MSNQIYHYDISKKGIDLLGKRDVPMLTNEQAIKDNIDNLFHTQPGSDFSDPERGIDLDRYIFEYRDELTADLMASDIETALEKYEERITDIEVRVTPDINEDTFLIDGNYKVRFSGKQQSFKVDFKKIR